MNNYYVNRWRVVYYWTVCISQVVGTTMLGYERDSDERDGNEARDGRQSITVITENSERSARS